MNHKESRVEGRSEPKLAKALQAVAEIGRNAHRMPLGLESRVRRCWPARICHHEQSIRSALGSQVGVGICARAYWISRVVVAAQTGSGAL